MLGDEHIIAPATYREQRPPYDMAEATCRAMTDANDAAVARLEKIVLTSNGTTKLSRWQWDYWREKLGSYDSTTPTGQRNGKRWTREERYSVVVDDKRIHHTKFFIGEYGVSSKGPDFVKTTWYPVEVDEKDK